MPEGRPPIYSQEILDKAWEYIDICEDDEIQQTIGMSAKGTELFKNKVIVKLPTKGGLARYLGVNRDTLYQWSKDHPEFSDIMESLGAKQEDELINKGLSGDYNPTIAKVLLTKHGYHDKQETDITTKGEKLPSSDDIDLDTLAQKMADKLKEEKL